jgi:CubicO group peptidase (beta-lactamase class C family)
MPKPLSRTPSIGLHRRHFLAALGGGLLASSRAFAASSPELISERLAHLEQDGTISGLHALLVSKGGKLVFEHYGRGEDETESRGRFGPVTFAPDAPHDLRSISKSVVGLVYGIALAAGKVPPPEAKLYDQFPEYPDLASQPGRDRITVHHVLSMTFGLDWDELTVPYGSDLRNSEIAMEAAPDRYRFILERPIIREPGAQWSYCGGATALLGWLIEKGTGEDLLTYSRRVLFDPLGFGATAWHKGNDGAYRAASGLRLLPPDLVKIGQLLLARGAWDGREVVPLDWLKRVITPVVTIADGRRYGYQWYLGANPAGSPPQLQQWVGGIGWGGQRLHVFPKLDLVVVQFCGNYDHTGREQTRVNNAVLGEVVLPGFV